MGEGAGHNQSLQNYPHEKGDNATLGNKVQPSMFRWGCRREAADTEHSPPHPGRWTGASPGEPSGEAGAAESEV